MIRALIVDDEQIAREHMARLLRDEEDIEVAGEARNGGEALEAIERMKPDVVFLDIEMPGGNGFDVISALTSPPIIVFVTAYDEFAIQAFEANAVDYVLKPVQAARVRQAIAKVRDAMKAHRQPSLDQMLAVFRQARRLPLTRLAVRKGKRIVLLGLREILYIGAEDKLVFAHRANDRFLLNQTVSQLEELLSDRGFFRISRGDLVNLDYVRELLPWVSGTWRVKLANGVELDVSRDRTRNLKQSMGL